MNGLYIFLVSFIFSFLGSIPPGTINISILQLSLNNKKAAAIRFALAAALIEYPYAYLAVKFSEYLSSSAWIAQYFSIIAGCTMLFLGISGLYFGRRNTERTTTLKDSGFRRGIIISLLNPLAIPFWIGISAWLTYEKIISISSELEIHYFVLGVSAGTFILLFALVYAASRIGKKIKENKWLKKGPALAFLSMGVYTLVKLLIG